MVNGTCPECDADVSFGSMPSMNLRVNCPRCRAALVVVGLEPIELDWAFIEPLGEPLHERVSQRVNLAWHRDV